MRTLLLALLAAGVLLAQKTSQENQVRDRGQIPPEGRREMPKQPHGRGQPVETIHGLLVDAGCKDRSTGNLREKPEQPLMAEQPASPNAASGVSVDSKTVERERAGVLEHQVPDLRSRQMDPSCAVTGATRSFLVLTDSGRLFKLDEGGNTFATQAVLASPAGRAMLNGEGPAFKPAITLRGWIDEDEVVVQKVLKLD